MKYENVKEGKFIVRENRFISKIEIDGQVETCHVKNTGRCKELLVEGVRVFVEPSKNPERKTKFSLITVEKGNILVNIDSQIPNKVVEESIDKIFENVTYLKRESKFQNSRFDFYMEQGDIKSYIEVKGVTLENNGVVSFPDAPSERAVKHLSELILAKESGFNAYVIFVVQLKGASYFTPNYITHKAFADKLCEAESKGVEVLCFDCIVEKDSIKLDKEVKVCLS
ncbi:MAG: DNA/RNA nuclease SfsA [Lachnospirales bacterium]